LNKLLGTFNYINRSGHCQSKSTVLVLDFLQDTALEGMEADIYLAFFQLQTQKHKLQLKYNSFSIIYC